MMFDNFKEESFDNCECCMLFLNKCPFNNGIYRPTIHMGSAKIRLVPIKELFN